MGDYQDLHDRFQRDGFVCGPKILSDQEVDELRAELSRVIDDHGKEGVPQPTQLVNLSGQEEAPVWQIVNIWHASPAFERLVKHPKIAAIAAAIVGAKELRLWHDQIQYKPAETGGVNMWHQDNPLWPPLSESHQITAWVALDEVAQDNGCMGMVPGSHKWGDCMEFLRTLESYEDLPADWEGHTVEQRLCPVEKGQIHFHHGLTWHGSNKNTSGRPRRAIALHFMTETTTHVPEKTHLCKDHIQSEAGEKVEGELLVQVY
jgi:ectoine hydroxylase-related dioxygenase (phytanoyl-CoA dioxygenase family)